MREEKLQKCLGGCGREKVHSYLFWCPACRKKFQAYLGPRTVRNTLFAGKTEHRKPAVAIRDERRLEDGFNEMLLN